MKYRVLFCCKYTTIEDSEAFAKEHLAFCRSLNLRGHTLVATEGIDGTSPGTVEETEEYMEAMQAGEHFKDALFKIDPAERMAFRKMFVRPRSKLVALNLEEGADPLETMGRYLEPAEFKEALLDKDIVVTDTRNDYEYDLGHFRGTVCPDIRSFHELSQWIHENKEQFMDKKIATYCIGRIRCKKFPDRLLEKGFEGVAQLYGGIINCGKDPETHGELQGGKMYIFDGRINVEINHVNKKVIGKDWFDGAPCECYINCADPECNRQILTSEKNEHKHLGGCSLERSQHPANCYVREHNLTEAEIAERLTLLKAVEV